MLASSLLALPGSRCPEDAGGSATPISKSGKAISPSASVCGEPGVSNRLLRLLSPEASLNSWLAVPVPILRSGVWGASKSPVDCVAGEGPNMDQEGVVQAVDQRARGKRARRG